MPEVLRPSKLIRDLLVTHGICQGDFNLPWRCYTQRMPDGIGTVDNAVTVADREDVETGRYLSDSVYRLDPHVQIIVRAVGFHASYDKMREITDFLDNINGEELVYEGETYQVIMAKRTTNVQFTGIDATGRRYIHTIEYDLRFN